VIFRENHFSPNQTMPKRKIKQIRRGRNKNFKKGQEFQSDTPEEAISYSTFMDMPIIECSFDNLRITSFLNP